MDREKYEHPFPSRFSRRFASMVGHRGRMVLSASFWSLVAKIAGAANVFVAIPFVLADLGPALFGAWATLVSLSLAIGFLDFGFGYGAMNLAAAAVGRSSPHEIPTIARAGATALLRITFVLCIVIAVAVPLVPWHVVLGLGEPAAISARQAVAAVLVAIAFAVPLNLSNRLQLGVGQGDRAFRWQAVGQGLALAITVLVALNGGSLTACVIATVGSPLIAAAANTASFYRSLRPDPSAPQLPVRSVRRNVRREGTQFFLLQLAAALAYTIDLPLISSLRGSEAAGHYAIVQRIFSVIPMTLSLIWAPLWPVYRHAITSNHLPWAFKTLRRSSIGAVIFAAGAGTLIAVLFEPLTRLGTRSEFAADWILLWGFVGWCVFEAAGTAMATFLNAAGVLDYQVRAACVFAVLCATSKYAAVRYLAIDALPWVLIVTYVVSNVVPFVLYRDRIFSRVSR
jgi:O-antigen/teichoic acid export membrane protein